MKKVNIEFVDVFDESGSFKDCLNDFLDKYYTTEGAEAPSVFLLLFNFVHTFDRMEAQYGK